VALHSFFIRQIKKFPRFTGILKKTAREVSPDKVVLLEYPINPKQRWDQNNPHKELYNIINKNRDVYKSNLRAFLELSEFFSEIPEQLSPNHLSDKPAWINGWMPALDGIALYSFLVFYKPEIYMEIGSGNSTRFARRAVKDHNLKTKIISIDPSPRAEIDKLCDEIVRKPAEEVNPELFDQLKQNDVLYIDNSHTVFMNSDSTVVFLEIIPRLRSGVLVEIHDITLPYDYPKEYIERYYSEQYLLAAYLLGKGDIFDIILPNMFISYDNELKNILAPFWEIENLRNVEKHGCSFWFIKK
jgi:hypothetical protein